MVNSIVEKSYKKWDTAAVRNTTEGTDNHKGKGTDNIAVREGSSPLQDI